MKTFGEYVTKEPWPLSLILDASLIKSEVFVFLAKASISFVFN